MKMIVKETKKDKEMMAKIVLIGGLVVLFSFVLPLIVYFSGNSRDSSKDNLVKTHTNISIRGRRLDKEKNGEDVVDNSSVEGTDSSDNSGVKRNLDDPFYSQIYDHMATLKSSPRISIPRNYQPKGNYLVNATREDGKLHTFKNQPILIYVPKNEYYDAIAQVFVSYNYQFKGLLEFKATTDPEKSNIKIVFKKDLSNLIDNPNVIGVGGIKKFDNEGNILYSELYVLDRSNMGYSPNMISVYNVILHEVGHCIGILGHSPNQEDLMYKAEHPKDNKELRFFSERDKETIALMYSGQDDLLESLLKYAKEEKLQENYEYAKEQNNSDSYISLAESYYNTGQYDKALEAYRTAMQMNPNNPNVYLKLAQFYIKQGKYNDALTYLQKLLQMVNDDESRAMVYDNIAYVYVKKNDFESARYYYYKALQLKPDDKDKFFNYIEACYELKRKDLAKDAYMMYYRGFDEELTDDEESLLKWAKS